MYFYKLDNYRSIVSFPCHLGTGNTQVFISFHQIYHYFNNSIKIIHVFRTYSQWCRIKASVPSSIQNNNKAVYPFCQGYGK